MDYMLAIRVTGRWGRNDRKIFTIITPGLCFYFLPAFLCFFLGGGGSIYEFVFPLLSDLHLSFILYPFEHSFLFVCFIHFSSFPLASLCHFLILSSSLSFFLFLILYVTCVVFLYSLCLFLCDIILAETQFAA